MTLPSIATNPAADRSRRIESPHVDPVFPARWSRRALSTEPLTQETIATLFEAARWAPSSHNSQPWLFVYADEPVGLAKLRSLVLDRNRRWADRAPVLALLFSRRTHPDSGDRLRTHAFDTGAAWMSLALQAEKLGLTTRAMGGVHIDATYGVAGLSSDEFEFLCAIAVGSRADVSELPEDLAAKESPSTRKPLAEVARRVP